MDPTNDVAAKIKSGTSLADFFQQEADRLLRSWAIVEADRVSSGPSFEQRSLDLSVAYRDCVAAAEQNANMVLGRLTDAPGTDKKSLFQIQKFLEEQPIIDALRSEEGSEFDSAISFLQKQCRWDGQVKAASWQESRCLALARPPYTLMKFRAEHKRFRDALFAHNGDTSTLGARWVHLTRRMIITCISIVRANSYVFRGYRWNAAGDFHEYLRNQIELKKGLSRQFLDVNASPFVWWAARRLIVT